MASSCCRYYLGAKKIARACWALYKMVADRCRPRCTTCSALVSMSFMTLSLVLVVVESAEIGGGCRSLPRENLAQDGVRAVLLLHLSGVHKSVQRRQCCGVGGRGYVHSCGYSYCTLMIRAANPAGRIRTIMFQFLLPSTPPPAPRLRLPEQTGAARLLRVERITARRTRPAARERTAEWKRRERLSPGSSPWVRVVDVGRGPAARSRLRGRQHRF